MNHPFFNEIFHVFSAVWFVIITEGSQKGKRVCVCLCGCVCVCAGGLPSCSLYTELEEKSDGEKNKNKTVVFL